MKTVVSAKVLVSGGTGVLETRKFVSSRKMRSSLVQISGGKENSRLLVKTELLVFRIQMRRNKKKASLHLFSTCIALDHFAMLTSFGMLKSAVGK